MAACTNKISEVKKINKNGKYNYIGTASFWGEPEGQGEMEDLETGAIYKGTFVKGKLNGKGTVRQKDSTVMQGNFTDGELNGVGEIKYKGGTVYQGNIKNGKKNGEGKETFNNGKLVRTGVWENGAPKSIKLQGVFSNEDFTLAGVSLTDSFSAAVKKLGEPTGRTENSTGTFYMWQNSLSVIAKSDKIIYAVHVAM